LSRDADICVLRDDIGRSPAVAASVSASRLPRSARREDSRGWR